MSTHNSTTVFESGRSVENGSTDLRKKTILHVGKFYAPDRGGIESHLQVLCTELQKSMDVRVIVSSRNSRSSEDTVDGVPVSRLPTPLTLFSTPICPDMVWKIRAAKADVIHIHLPNPAAVAAYFASGHRGRLVLSYHSDIVRQKILGKAIEPLMRMALRRSAAIIASSPNNIHSSALLTEFRDRCHVIPYGIPLEQFEQCDADAVARIRHQHGERLILSVGRLVYYKGFEYLIKAMTQVRGKLLIIGDGPLRSKLQELARQLGVAEKVLLLGKVEDVVPYYHAADVFALASVARSEAFGIVQIEAMAAGTPVVNTRLDSGVPFVSLHEETGLTVLPKDSAAMASALNQLLDQPELRQTLGHKARLRARREFSSEVMVSRMVKLYQAVAALGC